MDFRHSVVTFSLVSGEPEPRILFGGNAKPTNRQWLELARECARRGVQGVATGGERELVLEAIETVARDVRD